MITPDGSPATNHRVVAVMPLPGFQLDIAFESSERRIFDVSPYLDRGVFRQLNDRAVFRTAHVVAGSVEWTGDTPLSSPALSCDTLYAESVPIDGTASR